MPGLCVGFVAGTVARPPKWLPYKGKGRGELRSSPALIKNRSVMPVRAG